MTQKRVQERNTNKAKSWMLTEVDLVKLSTGFERGKGPLGSVRASVKISAQACLRKGLTF